VAGRNLVPRPAAGIIAFLTLKIFTPLFILLKSSLTISILSEKNIISNIYSKVFFIHTYIFVIVCKHNIDYKFSVLLSIFPFYTVKKFAAGGMNTVIVKTNLKLIEIIKDIYTRSRDDDVPALAAQLTYYFILALFPFLIFLITLLSYTPITGEEAMNFFARILPPLAFNAYWTL